MESTTLHAINGHTVVGSEGSGNGQFAESYPGDGTDKPKEEATDTLEALGLDQLRESHTGDNLNTSTPADSESYATLEEFDRQQNGNESYARSDGWYESDDEGGEDNQDGGGKNGSMRKAQDTDAGTAVAVEAYAASYPGLSSVAEVVIGRDDRRQVKETRPFPYGAIVQLSIEAKTGQRFVGTGWLISPRTVITAGHCVYLHGAGGWPKSITVTPGMNKQDKPLGSCSATTFRSVQGWVSSKESDYDYGAIILPQQYPFGAKTGTFKFASFTDQTLLSKYVNICGYPGDKGGKTQWYHAQKISRLTSKRVSYLIDTAGGQSGSPVFYRRDKIRVAIAIHTSGSMAGNSGTRINTSVKTNLDRWSKEGQ